MAVAVWGVALVTAAGYPRLRAQQSAPPAAGRSPQARSAQPATGTLARRSPAPVTQAATPIAPGALVDRYCATCHNARLKTAGLALDGADYTNIPAAAEVWEKVARKVRAGQMPPPGVPRPAQADLNALVAHLERTIDAAAFATPSLRGPTIHRLNRAEYANAIRDLLGVTVDVSSLLPPDEEAFGFDNNATVLGISTSLMERYLSASWKVAGVAVASPTITPTFETFRVRGDLSQHDHVDGLPIGTRGGIAVEYYFPVDGEYVIGPRLYRETVNIIRGLELPHEIEVALDGQRVKLATFGGPKDEQDNYLQPTLAGDEMEKRFQVRMPITAGLHTITVAFLKKSSASTLELLQPFGRERIDPITPVGIPELDRVTLEGPFNPAPVSASSPSRKKLLVCQPTAGTEDACARRVLTTLARRAFRGSLDDAESTRLISFYSEERKRGGSFDDGIEASLRYVLVSPRFLYRVEQDPAGVASGSPYRIPDLELASRLSFFLWSSIPDDELLAAAEQGRLKSPVVLERQIRRMLKDPRAAALSTNFAGQWLYLRNVKGTSPDPDVFPDFDHNLREGFERETQLLFDSIVREDRSVVTLLDADYTFLNERLAKHYGIPNVYGMQFRRVPVTDDARRGLLGHGSILSLTSYNNRTSPVLRGKYVLTNILGTPPPPPPDNVPPLDETPGKARSMRDRMEAHRRNPACASCHKLMDPIGLALENFDGIGKWRTADNGAAIDTKSQLSDGADVNGPADLRRAVLRRPEMFVRNLTEMLFTYALGHGVSHADMPHIRAILKDAGRANYAFSSIVVGIAKSLPFQQRRSES
jgi:mono/diheme cytochrome c family protein